MHDRYPSTWLTIWGAVATIFMCVGFMVLSVQSTIVLVVLGAAMVSLATVVYHCREGGGSITRAALARTAAASAAVGGGLAVAGVGLGVAGVGAAVLVLLTAMVTSPWTLGFARNRLGPRHDDRARAGAVREISSDSDPVPRFALPQEFQVLSDLELCRVWRASFCALQDARTALARERIFTLRHAYLAELERRDPNAIRAWLAAGARAAGGPEKFLTHPPDGGHQYAS